MVDGAPGVVRDGASRDRIGFLGHSTVVIELEGTRLLTDPLLRGRIAHLRRQVAAVDRAMSADPAAVLISHQHHDHLDLPSLRDLGRDTPLVVPAGAGAWLGRRGFTAVTELSVGDTTDVGRLTITAVPAAHDGRRPPGLWRAAALGYLVAGRRTVYFAGDTEIFDGMSELAPDLDVALLPVAGWGPKLGPGHMDPLDAARAAALLLPRLAIPIHWGTLLPIGIASRHRAALADPPRLFAEHVARLAANVQVRILAPGGETTL
jgi:L-ascorbate metabolism protein UlaG (beta-lactamase superfamily)